nr:MAG TPA: hypothetical protein [Crassvirales sp.]
MDFSFRLSNMVFSFCFPSQSVHHFKKSSEWPSSSRA